MKKFLTRGTVAARARASGDTVAAAARTGELRVAGITDSGMRLYDLADVADWIRLRELRRAQRQPCRARAQA